ncbi:MAG: WD40 repeat domain-containing protein [Myxococcales bacterium]|nr:WD40 repeat domain-containing protein [Myxococcales bacterium]
MRRSVLGLWVVGCLVACDDGEAGGGDAGTCNAATLIDQCPVGSSPVIGAQAEASCGGGAGLVQAADGATTGQCVGVAACRALCQFAVPCRCGVQQITAEGVVCASCEGAAACGDGVCAGGESPETCPVDCGARCEPDEVRCDGVVLEACSLQGRWDRLPCPAGEICVAEGGQGARCDRDPRVIGGEDAGVGDAGPPPADERIVPGEAPWPAVADRRVGQTPGGGFQAETFTVALTVGPSNTPSDFARARQAVGTCFEHRLGPAPATFECRGPAGWFTADFRGHPVPEDPENTIDSEVFCAAAAQCEGTPVDDCDAYVAEWRDRVGELRLRCIAAAIPGDCLTLAGLGCDVVARTPYPEDARFTRGAVVAAGDRVVGVGEDARQATWIDGAEVRHLAAPGELTFTQAVADATGDTAALLGEAGSDQAIVVWRPAADERRVVLARGVGRYGRLALGPDGQVLAARLQGDADPRLNQGVSFYDLASDARIFTLLPAADDRLGDGFAFSPDGVHFAVAVEPGGRVEIWDVAARQKRQTLAVPGGQAPQAFSFSPDGRVLAVISGPLSLWDVATGQRAQTVELVVPPQGGVTFTPDGQRAFLGGGVARRADFTVLRP